MKNSILKPKVVNRRSTIYLLLLAIFGFSLFAYMPPVHAAGPSAVVTPTTGLRDGQGVTVTWQGFDPQSFVVIRQCEANATQLSQCAGDNVAVVEQSSNDGSGLTYYYVVSTENTSNGSLPGAPGTQCGPSFPCEIVITPQDTSSDLTSGNTFPITFLPEASSCPTDNMTNITGSGAGSLFALMPNWQLPLCQGQQHVTVDYVSSRGDVGGVQDFSCGLVDFAITEIVTETGTKCPMTGTSRDAYYVPVANSALVFAYLMRNRLDFQRLPSINLTPDMLAQTMSGQALQWGGFGPYDDINRNIYEYNNPDSPKILSASGDGTTVNFTATSNFNTGDTFAVFGANPTCYNTRYTVATVDWVNSSNHALGQKITASGRCKLTYRSGGILNSTNMLPSNINVFGRADASGLNYLMSRFFLTRAAAALHAGGDQFSSQGFSTPSVYFPVSTNISASNFKSNQSAVANMMVGSATADQIGDQGYLAPMDAATAKYYGFPSISITSTDGKTFVAPTNQSIADGVSEMVTDQSTGVASANVSPKNQNAYPLVFTVYAVVPKHPESKELLSALKSMLSYIRDHGTQNELPDGYAPLTDSQKSSITEAITKLSLLSPSPTPSSSSSAQPLETVTPSPVGTSLPILPTLPVVTDPSTSGAGTPDPGNGGSSLLPSIFASPYIPHNGVAAGVLPALLFVGMTASVSGLLRRKNGASSNG